MYIHLGVDVAFYYWAVGKLIKDKSIGPSTDPERIGKDLANKLKMQGAEKILEEIFNEYR